MKVAFLAYRSWSKAVAPAVKNHPAVTAFEMWETLPEETSEAWNDIDLLITCGWSSELGPIANRILTIGVHCAELDRYSYGTPLQLQILDGIRRTKHRIFRFTHDTDSTRAHTHDRSFSHETYLDLTGNMDDIFEQLTVTSKLLFRWFLDDYPNIEWKQWPAETEVRKARVESDSKLTKENLQQMTCEQLYDFIRCLGEPYPNAYLEDQTGKLFFKQVDFKKK